jgi:hypothetical protein
MPHSLRVVIVSSTKWLCNYTRTVVWFFGLRLSSLLLGYPYRQHMKVQVRVKIKQRSAAGPHYQRPPDIWGRVKIKRRGTRVLIVT